MIKVEAFFPAQYVDIVYRSLKKIGIENMFITKGNSRGFFKGNSIIYQRGTKSYKPELLSSAKIEMIVREQDVEKLYDELSWITGSETSGAVGGKFLTYPIGNTSNLEKKTVTSKKSTN